MQIESESKREFDALGVLTRKLKFVEVNEDFVAGPVSGDLADKQPVVDMDVVHQKLADIH